MIDPVLHLLSEMNWLAIVVATVITFILGAIWYGPLFGKAWMKATGVTEETAGNPAKSMIGTFFLNLGTTIIIGMAVERFDIMYWPNGVTLGLGLGLGLYAFNLCSDYLFENRPMKLVLILSGYRVLSAGIIGGILSAWH